jgi:hypothetical protein
MGIMRALRIGSTPRVDVLASPFADTTLPQIAAADLFPGFDFSSMPVGRADAMKVPAVAKARNMLISTIAALPLRVLDKDGLVVEQPRWTSRTDTNMTPWQRMAWTVDDLLFFGASLWSVTRGADGYPLTMERIPAELWTVTNGTILVDGEPVDETQVVYFDGPHEGLLSLAAGTIRGGLDMERAWTARVASPIPAMELRETQDSGLTRPEIQGVVDAWNKARRDPKGSVGYVPYGFELVDHGTTDAALFEQGRNAVRTDIGAFANIPAAMLDASVTQASLTYQTQEGQRSEYLTSGAPFWSAPIAQRLSMDDVVTSGRRVRFDYGDLVAPTAAPTGIPTED